MGPAGGGFSCFVLSISQLHFFAVALQTRRDAVECQLVINATYAPDQVENPGSYQEPERLLDNSTWAKLRLDLNGEYPEPGVTSQGVRIPILNKLYAALPHFFKVVFPGGLWHLDSGSLFAAARTGTIMPWELDGDLAVNVTEFVTNSTMDTLRRVYGEPAAYSESGECSYNSESGRCPVWIISDEILFATLPLDEKPSHIYISRFIDRRTGYFIEIIQGPVASSTTQNSINGTLLPVPREPSVEEWLRSNYSDEVHFYLDNLERKMYECRCPEEHFKVLDVQPDPFQLLVMQPCGSATDAPWDLAEVNTDTACCRVADKDEDPSVPYKITIPWRPTVDVADS